MNKIVKEFERWASTQKPIVLEKAEPILDFAEEQRERIQALRAVLSVLADGVRELDQERLTPQVRRALGAAEGALHRTEEAPDA